MTADWEYKMRFLTLDPIEEISIKSTVLAKYTNNAFRRFGIQEKVMSSVHDHASDIKCAIGLIPTIKVSNGDFIHKFALVYKPLLQQNFPDLITFLKKTYVYFRRGKALRFWIKKGGKRLQNFSEIKWSGFSILLNSVTEQLNLLLNIIPQINGDSSYKKKPPSYSTELIETMKDLKNCVNTIHTNLILKFQSNFLPAFKILPLWEFAKSKFNIQKEATKIKH